MAKSASTRPTPARLLLTSIRRDQASLRSMSEIQAATSDLDGIHYLDVGTAGPTLVLLHGLGNSLEFWRPVVQYISDRRVIAIDIPGYGRSESTPEASASAITRRLHQLLCNLKAHPCTLVGHSLGGLLALDYSSRRPESVLNVVLLNAHLFSASDIMTGRLSVLDAPMLAVVLAANFLGGTVPMKGPIPFLVTATPFGRRLLLWPFLAAPGRTDGAILRSALAGNAGGVRTMIRAFRIAQEYNVRALCERVVCPVDVIWGGRDRLLLTRDHASVTSHLRVRRKIEVSDAAHWTNLERPELVAELLLANENSHHDH